MRDVFLPARHTQKSDGKLAKVIVFDALLRLGENGLAVWHRNAIYMEATDLDLIRLDPGGTARLEFLPRKKGHFVFFCAMEGQREAGMQGVLEVR